MNHPNNHISLSPEDCALLIDVLDNGFSLVSQHGKFYKLRESIQSCAALVPPPLNGDKVWSGLTFDRPQRTIIVRAKSRAEVVRMLNAAGYRYTAGYIKEYWSEDSSFRDYLLAAKDRGVYVCGPNGWEKKA